MNAGEIRQKLSPFLTLTFLPVAITGLLLFFEVRSGSVKVLHEWMSLLFLLCCAGHLLLNVKALGAGLRRGPLLAALAIVGLLTLAMGLAGAGHGGEEGNGHRHGRGHPSDSAAPGAPAHP